MAKENKADYGARYLPEPEELEQRIAEVRAKKIAKGEPDPSQHHARRNGQIDMIPTGGKMRQTRVMDLIGMQL